MEWLDAVNLLKYWGSGHPPVSELIAEFLGVQAREVAEAEADSAVGKVSAGEFDSLLEQHGIKGLLQ